MADRDVEINLIARDEASKPIGKVADSIDALPEDATVEVEAETKQAERGIKAFDRQVENLTDDARELRIQFKSEQLQREIRTTLRDIERLEDPVEIEARTTDLERAQKELRELATLAGEKYNVEVNADPKRTALRASGDLDMMRQRGEGLQSALPAISGFGSELGGASTAALGAAQGVADLGDFALIAGDQLGISSKAAAGLGTALGGAGLALAIGSIALPAIMKLISGQEELSEATQAAVSSLREQLGLVELLEDAVDDAQTGEPFLTALLGQFDGDEEKIDALADSIVALGGTVDGDLAGALRAVGDETGLRDMLADLPGAAELSAEELDELTAGFVAGVRGAEHFGRTIDEAGVTADKFGRSTEDSTSAVADFAARNSDAIDALGTLRDASDGIDLGAAYSEALTDIRQTEAGVKLLAEATKNVGEDASPEQLIAEYSRLADAADDGAGATDDFADSADAAADAAQAQADALTASANALLAGADAALAAAGANRTLADLTLAASAESDAWNATLWNNTIAIGEATEGTAAYRDAQRDTVSAAADLADSVVDVNAAAAEAEGVAYLASQGTSDWNAAMSDAARQASGPLRTAIIDYIAEVNGIEPEKVTAILAETDEGTVADAGAALDEVSETRESQIEAEAQTTQAMRDFDTAAAIERTSDVTQEAYTGQAEKDLNYTARARSTTITARYRTVGSPNFIAQPRTALPAIGAPIAQPLAARSADSGAAGAEYYNGTATPAQPTATRSAVVNNVTVNLPAATAGRDVLRSVRRWTRINGR